MRILFSLLFCMGLSAALSAQNTDHVYLKTGSVIRGEILEMVPSDHVKIGDFCGNIWYYKLEDVEKVTREPYTHPGRKPLGLGFEPGYVNITTMGLLAGSSDNAQVAPFSLQMVNGWRFSPGLLVGAGMGIEFLNTNYLPLFAEISVDLARSDVVPFLVARGGYSLPMKPDDSRYDVEYTYGGGALAAAGLGLKIRTRPHFAWDVMLLYRYQRTSYSEDYQYNDQVYDYTDIYNRIEIRAGFYID